MPTYDYKCADCGRVFEKFHSMNEQPQVECPGCHSVNTGKQVSLGAGVVFKGAGFYVNDYKKDSGGKSSASGSTATKEKSAASKSEASAAATPEASAGHVHGPGCNHG